MVRISSEYFGHILRCGLRVRRRISSPQTVKGSQLLHGESVVRTVWLRHCNIKKWIHRTLPTKKCSSTKWSLTTGSFKLPHVVYGRILWTFFTGQSGLGGHQIVELKSIGSLAPCFLPLTLQGIYTIVINAQKHGIYLLPLALLGHMTMIINFL